MSYKAIFPLVLIIVARLHPSFSTDITIDDAHDQHVFHLNELEYFVDEAGTLTFQNVNTSTFALQFQKNPDYTKQDFLPGAAYWIRMRIQHNPDSQKQWLLEFYDQTIDQITAYIPDEKGDYSIEEMGDQLLFAERNFQHKNFEVLLNPATDQPLTYYFRLQSHEPADVRIALKSLQGFIHYTLNEYLLFGIFYGIVLIISVYNLLMYFAIREGKYLIYIFYLLSVGVYAMCRDGIAYQYVWPNHPVWNQIATGVSIYCIVVSALLFTRYFLNTKNNAPVLDKIIVYFLFVKSVFFLLALFFEPLLTYRFIEIIPLTLIFYTSLYIWLRGYKPARFVVMAYGVLFIGFIVKSMVDGGLIPITTWLHYSLRICFVLEMLLLTFALGDKVHILKDMRDRAQRKIIQEHEINMNLREKVNQELEQKVKERTHEIDEKRRMLEEANQKLITQAQEINQINSMLDLENWKLRNNLKEVMQDRLFNKNLSLEEFSEIFPTTSTCHQYLEKLKWKDAYHCRKCSNDKYFDGNKKFSRRCTRCGYNESITAYTVFHGIKFPIKKAFYIAYIAVNSNQEYTLDELSDMLSLRRNTVWSFRQKLLKIIEGDRKNGKIHSERDLQHIIVEV